jgi:hypothetical protein
MNEVLKNTNVHKNHLGCKGLTTIKLQCLHFEDHQQLNYNAFAGKTTNN